MGVRLVLSERAWCGMRQYVSYYSQNKFSRRGASVRCHSHRRGCSPTCEVGSR